MFAAIFWFAVCFAALGIAAFGVGALIGAGIDLASGRHLALAFLVKLLLLVALFTGGTGDSRADGLTLPSGARLELGLGVTQLGSRNGIWYQDDYEHYAYDNHLRGSSQIVSLRLPKWRVSLVHMGRIWNTAMWGQYELVDELKGNFPRCDAGGKDLCYYGHGYGDVWGVSLGRVKELRLWGLNLEGEAGGFLYRATWHESGTGPDGITWAFDKTHAYEGGYPSKTSPTGDGWSAETHLTYLLGLGVRYKRLFGQFRYYGNVRDGNGLQGQMAKQVMLNVIIPLGASSSGGGGGW